LTTSVRIINPAYATQKPWVGLEHSVDLWWFIRSITQLTISCSPWTTITQFYDGDCLGQPCVETAQEPAGNVNNGAVCQHTHKHVDCCQYCPHSHMIYVPLAWPWRVSCFMIPWLNNCCCVGVSSKVKLSKGLGRQLPKRNKLAGSNVPLSATPKCPQPVSG